jgi:hypothetical protein
MSLTTVTLTRDLRPWRKGDDIHITPALADSLVKKGDATNPRAFVPPNASAVPVRTQTAPARPVLSLGRKARR